jgi:quercetin dioxygenase-like cupin family protein
MLKISIPPHARLPMHHHPVINAGLLTKGELTVITREGEKRRLCAGDPIVEVVNTMHYGINEGTKTAEIIVWYAGVEKESLTVIDEMIPDVGDYGH